jgi:hypothetical protein
MAQSLFVDNSCSFDMFSSSSGHGLMIVNEHVVDEYSMMEDFPTPPKLPSACSPFAAALDKDDETATELTSYQLRKRQWNDFQLDSEYDSEGEDDVLSFQDSSKLLMNRMFSYRLLFLSRQADGMQYELAVLSTLGGAYHLCNKPHGALYLAHRLEMLGQRLGSYALTMKAKGFIAVNIGLLGEENKALKMLSGLKHEAAQANSTEMTHFFGALRSWLKNQNKEKHVKHGSTEVGSADKSIDNGYHQTL